MVGSVAYLLPLSLAAAGQVHAPRPIPVFAWRVKELSHEPYVDSPYQHITQLYWLSKETARDPAAVKAATDRQPPGRRAIFDWDFYRAIYQHPSDKLKTAAGEEFCGPWWDHGLAETERAYDAFFHAYRELGGQLDYFVIDTEHGPDAEITTPERWAAVAADPRFAAMLAEMKLTSVDEITSAKPMSHVWWRYSEWLSARYYNRLMEVVRRYFPDVRCSDYGVAYHRPAGYVSWGATREVADIPGREGCHVGTHQAPSLYGIITYLGSLEVEGKPYGLGPFRSCMYACNLLRESLLQRPDVPLMPYLAWRGYISDWEQKPVAERPPYSSIGGTDYYQEVVFHASLCSPDAFVVWSAFRWREDQRPEDWCQTADLDLLERLMAQVNGLVGYADRQTLVTAMTPVHQPFILTGCRAGGRSVWRLTPDPAAGPVTVEGRQSAAQPLAIRIGDRRLVMPGAEVYDPEPRLSAAGMWLVGPANLTPAIAPE